MNVRAQPAPGTAFAAHGGTLTVHDSQGTIQATSAVLTSLGYSGEFFDAAAQQQYLRARFYNPANGRFNRLDPFVGNMQDPLSLHKYRYTSGDPILFGDPTGLFEGLIGALASMTIGTTADNKHNSGVAFHGTRGVTQAQKLVKQYNSFVRLLDRAQTTIDRVRTIIDLLDFSPSELKGVIGQLTGLQAELVGSALPNVATPLPEINIHGLKTKLRKVERKLGPILNSNAAQEALAEAMTSVVSGGLGFEGTDLVHWRWRSGIDQLAYQSTVGIWGIFEAKGGLFSKLGQAKYGGNGRYYVKQFGGPWIAHWLEYTIDLKGNQREPLQAKLASAYYGGQPMLAAIVRFDLLNAYLKITYQQYEKGWNIRWGNKY